MFRVSSNFYECFLGHNKTHREWIIVPLYDILKLLATYNTLLFFQTEDVLFLIFKEKASASDATTAGINYAIEFTDPVNGVFPKAYNECRKELTPMSFLWDPILCGKFTYLLLTLRNLQNTQPLFIRINYLYIVPSYFVVRSHASKKRIQNQNKQIKRKEKKRYRIVPHTFALLSRLGPPRYKHHNLKKIGHFFKVAIHIHLCHAE